MNRLRSLGPTIAGLAMTVSPQTAIAQPAAATNAAKRDSGCALPSEPRSIPAALDAAITGPADKDRACMKALLRPDARITFATVGADGAPSARVLTLDEWIARTRSLGHIMLEEKQLKFRIDRFGAIAHLWSLYALRSEGDPVKHGINSIEAIKGAGGWQVAGITVQGESAAAPLSGKDLP